MTHCKVNAFHLSPKLAAKIFFHLYDSPFSQACYIYRHLEKIHREGQSSPRRLPDERGCPSGNLDLPTFPQFRFNLDLTPLMGSNGKCTPAFRKLPFQFQSHRTYLVAVKQGSA